MVLLRTLAMQRDDLFGLPLKMGHDCRTSKEAAEKLKTCARRHARPFERRRGHFSYYAIAC